MGKVSLGGTFLIAKVISLVISLAGVVFLKILILLLAAELRGLTELSNPLFGNTDETDNHHNKE